MKDFVFHATTAFCRGVSRLGMRLVFLGWRRLPGGPVLLAGNHISHFDPPLLGSWAGRVVDFMAMDDLFRKPWMAAYMRALKIFPVNRQRSDPGALREAVRRLRAGRAVGFFPEAGIRSGGASVLGGAPMPGGAGLLAVLGGAVIVPCVVLGTDQLYARAAWGRRPRVFVAMGREIRVKAELGRDAAVAEADRELAEAWRSLAEEARRHPLWEDGLEPRTAQERWTEEEERRGLGR